VLPNPLAALAGNGHSVMAAPVREHPVLSNGPPATLRDHEVALIQQTIQAAGGIIGGPQGAAAMLGIKRTTLLSKMKRLGISRPRTQQLMGEVSKASELLM
jgi:formate hydrogenlyase transcriptional activator